jgi:hypothetical protein
MLTSLGLKDELASIVESVDRVCVISMMHLGALKKDGSGMVKDLNVFTLC